MLRRTFLAGTTLPLLAQRSRTVISIKEDQFLINGKPTYSGRRWNDHKIEGLLMNARMVQGTFDDENPETRERWAYPDTKRWDAERNTREFLAAMPEWRRHGVLSFTINFQGGSPQGYSQEQPWINSAFAPDGALKPSYLTRMKRILDRADQLGMVPIVGLFYFGQDERLKDEAAVINAARNAVQWLAGQGYRNVLIEAVNETNIKYDHGILQAARIHELIAMIKQWDFGGQRFLAGTSYGGGTIPSPAVVKASDFLLLHGNGVKDPKRITEMVRKTRAVEGYRPMPILFNEDDHFDFDKPSNNMLAALGEYASWGYFDPGLSNYQDGYQCPPVQWGINTERKKGFFNLVREVTGS